jgi:alpha-tubulin suppressor-like RCC1 family protein
MHTKNVSNVVMKMWVAMSLGAALAVGCGSAAGDEERALTTARQSQRAQPLPTLATGYAHTVAVRSNGTVWAWGSNGHGQLGDGTTTQRTTPVQVTGINNAVMVGAGAYHSSAILSDGSVLAWGENEHGQLGDGTTTDRTTPVQVQGLTGVVALSVGYQHTLALRTDGTVWAWGGNRYGQLGHLPSTTRVPAQIPGLTDVVAIAAGSFHSLAVRTDGTVWAWGRNEQGQLGNTTITGSSTTPVQVQGLSTAVDVGAGKGFSLAVLSDGTVRAWGDNYRGQLGDGTRVDRSTPVESKGLAGVMLVDGSTDEYLYSTALLADGSLRTWGSNSEGQLAQSRSSCPVLIECLTSVPSPTRVPGGITFVSAGNKFGVAQRSDGTVWTWGINTYGQLGTGWTGPDTDMPQQVPGLP